MRRAGEWGEDVWCDADPYASAGSVEGGGEPGKMTLGVCGCEKPIRDVQDGVEYCTKCRRPVPVGRLALVTVACSLTEIARRLEAIERRLPDGSQPEPQARLLEHGYHDAATVATIYKVDPRFVREHPKEFGGFRLGDGPKAPWRFDLAKARHRRGDKPVSPPKADTRRKRRTATLSGLLPVKGRQRA